MRASHSEVVFQNGQFTVQQISGAADLLPDADTTKRVYSMLHQQFDKSASCYIST
jgi:hypothetical protein